ncbi:hypothetical protein GOV13_02755 [Candidatus Pacearchaeota archaeon]|nr:hypothetical protein [Candidatus Pacearchaeota archaeon]
MARDQKLKELLQKKVEPPKEPIGQLFEETEQEAYAIGVSKGKEEYSGSGSSLIRAGIAMIVGIIVLVIVANIVNSSINGSSFFPMLEGTSLGATAFTVVGFITVGFALVMLVSTFSSISRF